MKILYLSYDGMTDPLGQSQVLPYLLELSKMGHQITLLSTEKEANFALRHQTIQNLLTEHQANHPEAAIDWQYITYTKKPPVLSTLKDIMQLRKKARQLHQQKQFDIIHCRSYVTSLIGLGMKKKYGTKFVFDMRGFWADERVDGGLWNLGNPLFRGVYNYFKKKEKQFLTAADYTISLTENAKQEIQNWPGFRQTKIEVIPCCVDTQLFDYNALPSPTMADPLKPITISYLGSIGTWYMLEEMLAFYQRLLKAAPAARFMFITTEPAEAIYQQAEKMELPAHQISVQKAERKQVPGLLAQSDVSIFFIKPYYSKKASSATKMGEILAMGIPIIANANVGDHDFLFEKYSCGVLVDGFDEALLDKAVAQIKEMQRIAPQDLRNVAIEYYSLKKGVNLYAKVYEQVK
ncbi:glycosyltransferase [Microscilla marina]|uniref:Glycosyl transferase, group 1 family protein n=1 Tax=Microscilla marina ATCC 23134 TaxID=313606 RepID=A1ZXW6_MICM2|nr:glycosyltransferase [Microscilla marina]EAY24795.1 glycosyl transferase, group 1 family protein [Microscilla marina ATCC 23134]